MKRPHNSIKAKPFSPADFLGYQNDAIVSREIVRQDTGTVTVFAFAKGQGLSEHTAPFDALLYILDGSAKITVAGKNHNVKSGEMIILPAHKPHSVKAVKQFKMILVMIKNISKK